MKKLIYIGDFATCELSDLARLPSYQVASTIFQLDLISSVELFSKARVFRITNHSIRDICLKGFRSTEEAYKGVPVTTLEYPSLPLFNKVLAVCTILYYVGKLIVTSKNERYTLITYSFGTSFRYWTPANVAAVMLKWFFNIKWLPLVADGKIPAKADAVIQLSYKNHIYAKNKGISSFLLRVVNSQPMIEKDSKPRLTQRQFHLGYVGALSSHNGLDVFMKKFLETDINCIIHVFGKGPQQDWFNNLNDDRVKYHGFVSDTDLIDRLQDVEVLLNVRSRIVQDNSLNFPSKILRYVGFGLPILSSKCDGIEPGLENTLVYFDDDQLNDMADKLEHIYKNYSAVKSKVANYGSVHSGPVTNHELKKFLFKI